MPDIFKLGKLKAVESREKKGWIIQEDRDPKKGKKERRKRKYKVEERIKETRCSYEKERESR